MNDNFDLRNYFDSRQVLDHGHVQFFDGMIQDPKLKIVNAARVSFHKEVDTLSQDDVKLINYLLKHQHYSTFRHSYFSFRVKAPLIVFRQWWKHQIGCDWLESENVGTIEIPETNWNEMSGRYVEFEPEFYVPSEIRKQSKSNKQGSDGVLSDVFIDGLAPVEFFKQSCLNQYKNYKTLVDAGAAKEQVRGLLPQTIYSECVWTCSLQCLIYFWEQRLMNSHAQQEIREYAKATFDLVSPVLRPLEIVEQHDK